jgi:glucokinase
MGAMTPDDPDDPDGPPVMSTTGAAGRRAGIDVGGTKFLGVVLDGAGHVIHESRRSTPSDQDEVIDALVSFSDELAPWDSLGIGVPGLVTYQGVLRAAPNIAGVAELAVGPRVSAALGRPVSVDNDATCAALAEWKWGAARGLTDVVMVTLGTGIGGGIVAGGRLQRGANGFAGEIGHIVVDPDGPPCPCGRRGCWERYASGSGLAQLAREAAVGRRVDRVVQLAGGDPELVRGEHVQAAAREGDENALQVIDTFGRWVAIGLVSLTNVLDPQIFVLGGGLAASADLYFEPISHWFKELLYAPHLRPHPALTFATLRERAGAVGAALLPEIHELSAAP